jgi:autotransporter-associated beta strand protein
VGSQAGKGGAWDANLTGALNIASTYTAGTLTLNATAASSISGSVTLAANSVNNWTVSPGVTMTASGVLAGSNASITKAGTGTMFLSANNTYNGTTVINAGTVQIGAGGTTGALSSGSAITNNATLVFNRSNTITQGTDFANSITGTGNLIQAGSGTLVLGTNTYNGATTVNAGTLQLAAT